MRLLIQYSPFRLLPGRAQGFLLGWLAMFQLQGSSPPGPVEPPVAALKSDALHFQRGIQSTFPSHFSIFTGPDP